MRISVTLLNGPHKGREFTFVGHDTFLVGRSSMAHLRLRHDRFCSRVHCLLEINPPSCRLVDLGSNNGTHVNGERVERRELQDGDRIRIGKHKLQIRILEADESEELDTGEVRLSTFIQPEAQGVPAGHRLLGDIRRCSACDEALASAEDSTVTPDPAAALFPLCRECLLQVNQLTQPVPGYLLVRPLGKGGMGVVYLALRRSDGQRVALKTLLPAYAGTVRQRERFLRESQILQGLRHPNIVSVLEVGEVNDLFYFAMDHVPGWDGRRLLEREGPLAPARAVHLIDQLLDALEYAHKEQIVHRDIKPSNLMVVQSEGVEQVRVIDFGLARIYHNSPLSGLTLTGDIGGTPAFMAPEQILNFRGVTPASDQYSASAALYNLLTGKYVHDLPEEHYEQFLCILEREPVPIQQRRPEIPVALAQAIHRGLHPDPKQRYPDVGTMRRALHAAMSFSR